MAEKDNTIEFPERRSPDDALIERIIEIIRNNPASYAISEEIHREHHEFVQAWISEQQRKAERWERIKTQVSGWLVISALGAIGTAAYNTIIYLKDHLK